MPSGKVILTLSRNSCTSSHKNLSLQFSEVRLNENTRTKKSKIKAIKPIPEGCYATVLYVQLNLLFCGLWELKYMPATLRWCPPLWHPTHPRDFLRFWARCRFKISLRVSGRQLLARSARTVPALFQCVHFFFKSVFILFFTLHFHCSFPKHLDWSIIFVFHWSRLCSMASAHHRPCHLHDYIHGRRSTFLLVEVNAG